MTERASKTRLICPLISETIDEMRAEMSQAVERGADTVECRLDYLTDPLDERALRRLLTDAPLDVIVTCRPERQGGRFAGSESDRLAILRSAARAALVFVDVERDAADDKLPDGAVILSHHDFAALPGDLDRIAAELDASPAAVNKVAFAVAGPDEALRAFDVVRNCRKPTLALAMGEAGVLTRILAGKVGAFGTFASLDAGAESAPGQPTLAEMRELYRWDAMGAETSVYGVIGCPVAHSMSPAIHNAAFAAAGVDGVYVPLRIEPAAEPFNRFIDGVLERPWLGWRGLSVTIPHKENALARIGADNCDPLAVRIGAVNTVTIGPGGALRGDNTDYAAAIDALCDAMGIAREQLAGRSVAVLGAGGAARAIVAALAHYGAETTIYNRTVSRAERLAGEFECRPAGLDALESLDAEIVINCTPIGMHPGTDATPLESIPSGVEVVFDTIYNPMRTKLLDLAARAGARTVSGVEMFVNQGVRQFEIWTGREAPRETMRDVVIARLSEDR